MEEWRNGGMEEWRNGGMVEWRNGGAEEQHKRCQAQEGRKGPPRSVKGELCQAGSECIDEEKKTRAENSPRPSVCTRIRTQETISAARLGFPQSKPDSAAGHTHQCLEVNVGVHREHGGKPGDGAWARVRTATPTCHTTHRPNPEHVTLNRDAIPVLL